MTDSEDKEKRDRLLRQILEAQASVTAFFEDATKVRGYYREQIELTAEQTERSVQLALSRAASLAAPENMVKLTGKPLVLDIPDTIEKEVQAFAHGEISRQDFIHALESQRQYCMLSPAEIPRLHEILADQVEQAGKQHVEIHAGFHPMNRNSPAAKAEDAFFKPIEEAFKAKERIDPAENRAAAIDHDFRGFTRQWIADHHQQDAYAGIEAAVAAQHHREDPLYAKIAAGEMITAVGGRQTDALVKSLDPAIGGGVQPADAGHDQLSPPAPTPPVAASRRPGRPGPG